MLEFSAIGTEWTIDLPTMPPEKVALFLEKILARAELYDKNYSRFRGDSLIASMATSAGEYILPDDAKPLFDLYKEMYSATNGLVTPLIGQVLVDAGYDSTYSLVPGILNTPPAWDDVIQYEFPKLTLLQPAILDLGAAGKGYLVDIIAELLEGEGVEQYVIDAGGDIRCKGSEASPSIIGLEDPNNSQQVIGTVQILTGSICGSAGNRRAWNNYHHIINPQTLESPKDISAVWVRATEACVADILTTCLYLLPPEELIKKISNFPEFFILYSDYSFKQSDGFGAELFSNP
jgi:thiamine biosynthesis lipoprotein